MSTALEFKDRGIRKEFVGKSQFLFCQISFLKSASIIILDETFPQLLDLLEALGGNVLLMQF